VNQRFLIWIGYVRVIVTAGASQTTDVGAMASRDGEDGRFLDAE